MDLSFIFDSKEILSLAKNSEALTNHWETVFKNLSISPDQNKILNYTSREFLVNRQIEALEAHEESKNWEKENTGKYFRIRNSVSQEIQHSISKIELVDLNRIGIKDLILSINSPVNGKFLLCRNITLPLKMTAFTTIVDDPRGKSVRLSLYNFTTAKENLHEIMPIGTILAIKNPFFKTSADGGLILRCDDPASVLYIDSDSYQRLFSHVKWMKDVHGSFNDTQLPDNMENRNPDNEREALYWKNLGNVHYHGKDYSSAVNAYSSGLKALPSNIELLSNRSAAYLSLHWFSNAYDDADRILLHNPYHLKAICRKSKALCGMNKCKDAVEFLRTMISNVPNELLDKQILNVVLDTTIIMQQQQEFGVFPVGKLRENGWIHLENCAEYSGPVKIVEVEGKGRGLVATKNISAGGLLIASRAFEIDFSENENKDEFNFSLSKDTKEVCVISNSNLIRQIALRLTAEPKFRKEFYNLYAGPQYVDVDDNLDGESLDLQRIKSICKLNSFQLDKPEQAMLIEGRIPAGIWLLPSYINNSCADANCSYDIYGDFMFIRACKDIKVDEEILISYMHPTNCFELREKRFKEVYEFTCSCTLCENDRNDPMNSLTRNSTLKMFYQDKQNNELDIDRLNRYLTALRTFPRNTSTLNTELLALLVELSMQYMHNNVKYPEKAVVTLEEAYRLVTGSSLVHYKVNICKYLVAVNLMLNSKTGKSKQNSHFLTNAKEWAMKLKTDLQIAYGNDVKIEEAVSKTFLNFIKSEGVHI